PQPQMPCRSLLAARGGEGGPRCRAVGGEPQTQCQYCSPPTMLRMVPPCNLSCASSDKGGVAVMRGSSGPPGVRQPDREQGAPRIDPSIPNSRRGRQRASPIRQGGDEMEITVGIDVSKARLDVHVQP